MSASRTAEPEEARATEVAPLSETEFDGLYASAPEPLPFAPSLHARAFLLRREPGNLLVYSVPGLRSGGRPVDALGGVARQYLNHGHEAMFASELVTAPLFVHEGDRSSVESRAHMRATFSRRHELDDDFEVIPTPGHTPGATAFLWNGEGHRFLFTGDTIYLSDGEWAAAVLDSSDRASYIRSLELIRGLDFDVLVPWIATAGRPYAAAVGRDEARDHVDEILERLRRGESR
jgi:hypothetical protein